MKTCIVPLFLFLAANGAWATFPLPYIQFGLLPPPYNFNLYPAPRFGAQRPFFVYPQFGRDFLDVYQSLSFVQPQRYNYYEYPQPTRYPSYPQYIPTPQNSHNPVVQYVYEQTPQHLLPSSLEVPLKNPGPVLQVFNKVPEQPQPEKVTKQPAEATEVPKPAEVATNPTNSGSEPASTKPTQQEEAENITAQSTEATESGATYSMGETPTESTTTA